MVMRAFMIEVSCYGYEGIDAVKTALHDCRNPPVHRGNAHHITYTDYAYCSDMGGFWWLAGSTTDKFVGGVMI